MMKRLQIEMSSHLKRTLKEMSNQYNKSMKQIVLEALQPKIEEFYDIQGIRDAMQAPEYREKIEEIQDDMEEIEKRLEVGQE